MDAGFFARCPAILPGVPKALLKVPGDKKRLPEDGSEGFNREPGCENAWVIYPSGLPADITRIDAEFPGECLAEVGYVFEACPVGSFCYRQI